jgi:hypothetical protein
MAFKGLKGMTSIRATRIQTLMPKIPLGLKEKLVIEPFSQRFCTMTAQTSGCNSNKEQTFHVTPVWTVTEPKSILVGQGVTKLFRNECSILIANASDKRVVIPKGTICATLIPTKEFEDFEGLQIGESIEATNNAAKLPKSESEVEQEVASTSSKVEKLIGSLQIKLENFEEPVAKRIIQILTKHADVFSDAPGLCTLIHHAIDTGTNPPILCQAYREPHRLKPVIKEIVNDMLKNDLIRPSKSPWAFPVVIVPKPDGKWRFTVDYRKLNNIVPRDAFPLPLITDHLTALGEAKWFTVLDLVSGYWQIPVREEDIEKTAFICSEGLYE